MKKNALKLVAAACALTVGVALFACAPQQPVTDADQAAGGTAEEQVDATAEAGQYQSDSACLAMAVLTRPLPRQRRTMVSPIRITPFTVVTIPA